MIDIPFVTQSRAYCNLDAPTAAKVVVHQPELRDLGRYSPPWLALPGAWQAELLPRHPPGSGVPWAGLEDPAIRVHPLLPANQWETKPASATKRHGVGQRYPAAQVARDRN